MSDRKKRESLSSEELQKQGWEPLSEQEAMSLINANLAAPVNAAVALDALGDESASKTKRGRETEK